MTTPILVTGGTGTLGKHVVRRLRAAGRDVRILSRSRHAAEPGIEYALGDIATGEGVDAAVEGVETIIHLAGSQKGDDVKTRNLVLAASALPKAPHLVYISVVGADRVPVVSGVDRAMFGYFAAKLASERIVQESGLPWTILRATQFHELTLTTARQMAKMPVVPIPSGTRFQPIAADEVAARLVELALGEPAGRVPDMAGPEVYTFKELVRSYLKASHTWRPLMSLRMPGRAARAFRSGVNLAPGRAVGHRTWSQFLAEQVG
jgi:uncharacterized protein YbjT (DUF2867 family)